MSELGAPASHSDATNGLVRFILRHQASLLLNGRFEITAVGERICSAFQLAEHQLLGRSFFELFTKQCDGADLRDTFRRFLETGVLAGNLRVQCRADSGEMRTVGIDACLVGAPDGTRLLVTLDSVLDRELRTAAQNSDERFRLLVDSLTEHAIFTLDPEGNLTSWNPGAERIMGYTAAEIIGRHFSCFFPEEDVKADKPARELEIAALLGRHDEEGWRVRKDGTLFFANVFITAMRSPDGALLGFAKVTRDATEPRRLMSELERSNRVLEQFAYVASHDLQEPLRMVSAWVGFLDRHFTGAADPKVQKALGYVVEGAQRMRVLIRDLLSYSKLKRAPFPEGVTDLGKALAEATSLLKEAVDESGASIVVAGPLPTIPGTHGQMVQLFQNLLGNAVKFRRRDVIPEIVVGALRVGNDWTLSVRDNGIGIDPSAHDQVFKILQRLHNTDEYPGSGMGLSICKRIVEHHGGKIWLESNPGNGATFFFTLPADKRYL